MSALTEEAAFESRKGRLKRIIIKRVGSRGGSFAGAVKGAEIKLKYREILIENAKC